MQDIILGGGCFWCTESVFRHVKGVTDVTSGYAGGKASTAHYDAVCTGQTEHVEVVKVVYDDSVIDLNTLLDVFFATHDPTTLNRQGNDVGAQYASVIFYTTDEQKRTADELIGSLNAQGLKLVTRVEPLPEFYAAEDYHQDFYRKNPSQGYCNAVIPPKLAKLKQSFQDSVVNMSY